MKIAILGAGRQARGALSFFARDDNAVAEIAVVDNNRAVAESLAQEFIDGNGCAPPDLQHSILITAHSVDASSETDLAGFLGHYDAAFNALPYTLALRATRAAIRAKCNLVDLGGNSVIVDEQMKLSGAAKASGVTIIPDCGLAPGLVSLLVADAMENSRIANMHSVKIYVGGIPLRAEEGGLLKYCQVFSLAGLVNEYKQPVRVLRDGKIQSIEPLTGLESVETPHGTFEAFTTSGGASTLPSYYQGHINSLEYKTLRFPGHLERLRVLQATDNLTAETFEKIVPKNVIDQVIIKVVAQGSSVDGHLVRREYYTRHPGALGITAMAVCTAFPAAVILGMLSDLPSGVHTQESVIDPQKAIAELKKAGIRFEISDKIIYRQ